jgi:hypothetical protein
VADVRLRGFLNEIIQSAFDVLYGGSRMFSIVHEIINVGAVVSVRVNQHLVGFYNISVTSRQTIIQFSSSIIHVLATDQESQTIVSNGNCWFGRHGLRSEHGSENGLGLRLGFMSTQNNFSHGSGLAFRSGSGLANGHRRFNS